MTGTPALREARADEGRLPPDGPVATDPGRRSPLRARVRTIGPLVLLAVVAIAIALWSNHEIYPGYSWNRDEPVYLWQVEALRDGQVTTTDGGAPRFFRPWLTGWQDDAFFSQYTLGWPLVLLAADVVTGSPAAGTALGAVLVVLGTYALARELTRDRRLALLAGGLVTVSPILAIQSGVYLGYLFTLGVGLLFATGLLSGVRQGSRARLLGAGALLGWVFLTRPFDAVLWGAAVGGTALWMHRRRWRSLVPLAGWLAAGSLPLVAITLAYNQHVTGSFLEFPITATDPLDTFGFGHRRIMPDFPITDYHPVEALRSTAKNLFYVPLFMAGAHLGVVVAAVGLWIRRREPGTAVLLAIGAAFPVGYLFFWGMNVSAITAGVSGPIYFVPLYAPLSILAAAAVVAAWRRRPALGVGVVAALLVVTVPVAANRLAVNQRMSEAQLPWRGATDPIDERALVFVSESGPYLLFLNPFSDNGPDLDDRVLFATDEAGANIDLIRRMPDRTPYLEQASYAGHELAQPRQDPYTPTITLTPLRVEAGEIATVRVRVENPRDVPCVAAVLRLRGDTDWRTLSCDSGAGDVHETAWTVAVPEAGDAGAVVPREGPGRLVVEVGYGTSLTGALRRPALRQTFSYRVRDGELELLVPPVTRRLLDVEGALVWRPTTEPTALEVDVAVDGVTTHDG